MHLDSQQTSSLQSPDLPSHDYHFFGSLTEILSRELFFNNKDMDVYEKLVFIYLGTFYELETSKDKCDVEKLLIYCMKLRKINLIH